MNGFSKDPPASNLARDLTIGHSAITMTGLEHQNQTMPFAELKEPGKPTGVARRRSGVLIKSAEMNTVGIQKMDLPQMETNQPMVMLHRIDETAGILEFVCVCGCKATVKLEYEGSENPPDPGP